MWIHSVSRAGNETKTIRWCEYTVSRAGNETKTIRWCEYIQSLELETRQKQYDDVDRNCVNPTQRKELKCATYINRILTCGICTVTPGTSHIIRCLKMLRGIFLNNDSFLRKNNVIYIIILNNVIYIIILNNIIYIIILIAFFNLLTADKSCWICPLFCKSCASR